MRGLRGHQRHSRGHRAVSAPTDAPTTATAATAASARAPEGWSFLIEEPFAWERFRLAIDTDAFAGNFAVSLCAACTGQLDDRGRDRDFARTLARDYDGPPCADLVERYPANGIDGQQLWCVDIAPLPGSAPWARAQGFYNSARIYLARPPTAEEFASIQRRALAFAARGYELEEHLDPTPFTILGFRLERSFAVTQSFTQPQHNPTPQEGTTP